MFSVFSLASDSSLIEAASKSQRAGGVFMLIEGGRYTFNFTAARAACLFLNVTIATRAQLDRALQRGLETCKFGWIDEQIAVIPRLTADKNCGQSKTGVVTWPARADKKFGVFCFNASDLEGTLKTSTSDPRTFSSSTSLETQTQTSVRSTTEAPPPRKLKTTKSPQRVSLTSAFILPVKTSPSAVFSSTSPPPKPVSTRTSTSLPQLITSSSAVSVSSELVLLSSAKPSLGAVPTAIIVLSIILLVLTAAGVVWYYKLGKGNIFPFWSQRQQKDDIETEMWKQTGSELDLQSRHGAEEEEEDEEEETDRKYSGDVMMFMNPDVKADLSE
ncbi:hypothetical protein PAMA_019798 [Pampus argenteus]